jgi:uncharacterized protein YdaU (DUF1376 family)
MADTDAWMPLWVGDYLADTQDLTTEEHGAYLLLLMTAWRNGGRLPAAPDRLARIAKLKAREWSETWKALERFFDRDGEELVQNRLARELAEAIAKRAAASEHGRKGARARHGSSPGSARAEPEQEAYAAREEPGDKPSPSPSEKRESPPARDLWDSEQWYDKFRVAWSRAKNRLTYGNGDDDAKAKGEFTDMLASLPLDERITAQGLVQELFARYFAIAAAPGHPWKWFVKRFNELRTPIQVSHTQKTAPTSPAVERARQQWAGR